MSGFHRIEITSNSHWSNHICIHKKWIFMGQKFLTQNRIKTNLFLIWVFSGLVQQQILMKVFKWACQTSDPYSQSMKTSLIANVPKEKTNKKIVPYRRSMHMYWAKAESHIGLWHLIQSTENIFLSRHNFSETFPAIK